MNRCRIGIGLLLILLSAAYLATGLVVVEPGEVVVIRRLGRVLESPWRPGPHWGGPFGFDRFDRLRTDEVRRLAVGLVGVPGPGEEPGAGEYLTGDRNIVRARAVVQYRVADPVAFVLRSRDRELLLERLAESALVRALSSRGIDAVLRTERVDVSREVAAILAREADRQGLGVAVLGVSLIDARAPTEVQAAFAEAQSARSMADRRAFEAESYAASTLSEARAEAGAAIENAHAEADRAVAIAAGRADRFRSLLAEADESRALTVQRIYLQNLQELLTKVRRKLVLTPDEPLDLSLFGAEGH
ncbi:FtsH protease activity modulator HflK [soil metagenome]